MQANTMELTRTVRSMRAQMAEWTVILDRMERELEDHQTSGHSTVMCPSSTAAEFGYEFMGQSFSAHDGADVLLSILRLFAKQAPEFPERFRRAVEPLGRTRPYVARSPESVYPGKPRLRKFTKVFAPGWYIGTNESNDKKVELVRTACQTFGVRFGRDLKVRM
jgi:hypothetical protein